MVDTNNETEVKVQYNGSFDQERDVSYQIFKRMEFSSDRKRMSILFKDPDDGLIKLYTKGADCEISKRLDENQTNQEIKNKID